SEQAQFSLLAAWLEEKGDGLRSVLAPPGETLLERYILFGEWMVAVHSIPYSKLPDWFVAFDIFDRLERRFLAPEKVRKRVERTGIAIVPTSYEGALNDVGMLEGFLDMESAFSHGNRVEGVVVRFANGERGKVVRGDFLAGDRHWSKNEMKKNI